MRIDFPTSSNPGTIPQEGDGRLINAMAEKVGDLVKWIRQPGVTEWATSSDTGFRGSAFSTKGQILYGAFSEKLNKVASPTGGAMSLVGALPGSGKARFAFNQNTVPDQLVVTDPGGMSSFTDSSVTAVGGLAALPIDVCYVGGYFFYISTDGRCFNSGVNNATFSGTAATAEGKPDGLLRCLGFMDQLYLLGPDAIEVWGKPINLSGFPFNRVTVIPRGIAGPDCVTGTENGIDLGLIIVSGNNQVMRINGYTPERISMPDVERDIAALASKATIELTSFVSDGHMYVKVRSPLWCWLYDLTTQAWVERTSYLLPTSRILQAVSAFNSQIWVVGDSASGNLGVINANDFTEYNQPLIWECWSRRPSPFPARTVVGPAHFEFVPGQGKSLGISPIQTFPRVNISWSDDGGLSFVPFRIAELGRQAVTTNLVRVTLTGSTGPFGRIWRVRISDPVYVSFKGGDMPRISRRAVA